MPAQNAGASQGATLVDVSGELSSDPKAQTPPTGGSSGDAGSGSVASSAGATGDENADVAGGSESGASRQAPPESALSEPTPAYSPEDEEWISTDSGSRGLGSTSSPGSGGGPGAGSGAGQSAFAPPSAARQTETYQGMPLETGTSSQNASQGARSFEGTTLDARAARDLEGSAVEAWRFQDTQLDTRAAREVEGRTLKASEQRFLGTTLDARADRSNSSSSLSAVNLTRRFSTDLFLDPVPPSAGRFIVLLGPAPDLVFQECSGLGFRLEPQLYAEGGADHQRQFPGQVLFDPIVFRRGLVIGPGWIQLRRWRESMLSEDAPLRMSGVIVLQNDLGVPICIWRFKNGWPVRWSGPVLRPGSTDLAVEELEIAHEGLKVLDQLLLAGTASDMASGMASALTSELGGSAGAEGMGIAQSVMSGDVSALVGMGGG